MTRAPLTVVLFVLVGAAVTLVVYRIVLGGPLALAAPERSLDGLIVFLSIAMNTALAFGAAAVAAVMAAQARWPFAGLLLVSAGSAGILGAGMTLWFSGLNWAFPAVMALAGGFCTFLAARLGLLPPARARGD